MMIKFRIWGPQFQTNPNGDFQCVCVCVQNLGDSIMKLPEVDLTQRQMFIYYEVLTKRIRYIYSTTSLDKP